MWCISLPCRPVHRVIHYLGAKRSTRKCVFMSSVKLRSNRSIEVLNFINVCVAISVVVYLTMSSSFSLYCLCPFPKLHLVAIFAVYTLADHVRSCKYCSFSFFLRFSLVVMLCVVGAGRGAHVGRSWNIDYLDPETSTV